MRTFIQVAALIVLLAPRSAHAGDITVMSSNAMRNAFDILVPQFEKATGHKVHMTLLLARSRPAAASTWSTRSSASRYAEGSPKPDVRPWEALKGAIAAANVIVLSSGPSSVYLLDFSRSAAS
jgi:hypothetical protein